MPRRFLCDSLSGDRTAAVERLKQSPWLINHPWEWETTVVDGDRWLSPGDSALMAAIRSRNLALVRDLLKSGADVNMRNANGDDALRLCCWRGLAQEVAMLLDAGADPHHVNKGWSCLGIAARKDFFPVCLILIAHGADLMATMYDGRNALELYGCMAPATLSELALAERTKSLRNAFAEGPHPSQVKRRRDAQVAKILSQTTEAASPSSESDIMSASLSEIAKMLKEVRIGV